MKLTLPEIGASTANRIRGRLQVAQASSPRVEFLPSLRPSPQLAPLKPPLYELQLIFDQPKVRLWIAGRSLSR
jgi:hypothetical protein